MNGDSWREIFETDLENRGIYDDWNFYVDEHFQERKHWQKYLLCCFARFRCSICGRFWASSKVHIIFHMKLKRRTGQVRMHAFNQKCKKCTAAEYEEPAFQDVNIEIAIGKLVNKILQRFYNMPIDDMPRSFVADGWQDGPHDSNNCEGCALGICECYTDTQYYDKTPVLPKRANKRSKPKKKRFPRTTSYYHHPGPSQSQTSVTGGRSDYTAYELLDEPSDSSESCCPCCVIL